MTPYHLFLGGEVRYSIPHTSAENPYIILIPPHTTGTITVDISLAAQASQAHVIMLQWICHSRVRIVTTQQHNVVDTTSSIDVRAVVGENGESLYEGLIAIHAQQSNATQTHRALMIADTAQAQATPALEVLTHNVQCAHASAIGPIDEPMLTQCLIRGIPAHEGRLLIAYGILRDAIPHNHPAQEVISSWMCHK